MKHKRIMLTITALIMNVVSVLAVQTEINGIMYDVNTETKVAEVIEKFPKYTGNIVIPARIVVENKECSVTTIKSWAFNDCTELTSVTIPSSVTTIENYAIFGCTSLTSVTIPSSVTTIGICAFCRCTGLTSVTIPSSVTTIGDAAFSHCNSLNSIVVNSSNGTFDTRENCNAIIETATNTLIAGCQNSFIPSSVTSIGNYAFYGCTGLTSIAIPSSVTSIVKNAFYECTGLTSVTIPSSVTSIGNNAFYGCTNLTSVVVEWTEPISISSSTFPNRMNTTLYVPNGSKPAYEIADYWNQFKAINGLPNPNTINVGSTGYATFCSPNAMDFTDVNDIKAYIASGFEPSTGTLVLTRAIKVPAGEGLYIVGTPGTYDVPETTTDMVYSNLLKGVTTATTIYPTDGSNTNFILANGNYGIGFYTLSEAGEIAAGKAYLQLPTASVSNVKAINFVFSDDSETSISDAKDIREVKEVYNLQGQRISRPKHGLYIINGKKVIIK